MDVIENLSAAFTFSCMIYASLKMYSNMNMNKQASSVEALEAHIEKKEQLLKNKTDYNEISTSGSSSDSMDREYSLSDANANGLDNKQSEYYNIITVDNKQYKNEIEQLQKQLTSTSRIVNENTSSINELKSIVKDQQKCIEEQRSLNSQLLLKLNDTKILEKKLDEYSVDKKWLIQYNSRTNKILNGLVTKISTLKRVNVTKKQFKILKRNIANAKKTIMATQSVYKNHIDGKISNIVRKYDKIKNKRDMMSFYAMGLNSSSFSNMPMTRNDRSIPEMFTRNPKINSFFYETPPVETITTTPSVAKIPVPPPMPVIPVPPPMPSTSTLISPKVSVASVVPPVPSVPPMPLELPAELLDDYGRFAVTKNLLKTVTLTPPSDTPRKIKKPQCMIDASKKKADAEKIAEDNCPDTTVPAEFTVAEDLGQS